MRTATATRRVTRHQGGIQQVPLNLIDPGPIAKLGGPLPGQTQEDLYTIMAEEGLLSCQIFLVRRKPRPTKKRKFELLGGDECLLAAKGSHTRTVNVLVVDEVSDSQVAALQATHKYYHPRPTPLGQARCGQFLIGRLGLELTMVARLLRLSERRLTRLLRYLTLPADVQDFLEAKQLKIGHVEELLRLATAAEQRVAAHEAVRSLFTVDQLREYLHPKPPSPDEVVDAGVPVEANGQPEAVPSNGNLPTLLTQIQQLVTKVEAAVPSTADVDKTLLGHRLDNIIRRLAAAREYF